MSRNRWGWIIASLGAGALWAGCETTSEQRAQSAARSPNDPSAYDDRVENEVFEALERGEPQEVLVTFDDASLASLAFASLGHAPQTSEDFARVVELRRRALAPLREAFVKDVSMRNVVPTRTYDNLPIVVATLDSLDDLDAVLAQRGTTHIERVAAFSLADAQSNPLIRQPAVQMAGKTGRGATVAVLDTGANYTHADLGSCTAPNTGASCKVVYAADFAQSDGSLDDNGHGTNVSAIVLQVAPEARIAALDVFTGGSAYSSDIVAAIDWVIANRATYDIAALNMSLGGGSFSSACPSGAFPAAIDSARAAGVLSVIASGNNAYANALASPACAPTEIAVGAVYDANVGGLGFSVCTDASTAADRVTCFSNSASFLTMLAPGAMIQGGGYNMAGTSQAAPHVAGAVAVLRAAFPLETLDQTVTRLTSTGVSVTDSRQSRVKPRLDMVGAAADDCTIAVSSSAFDASFEGQTLQVSVATGASCAWTATTDDGWLRLSGASGTGNGSITITVEASPTGDARTGRVAIGDRVVTISQGADDAGPSGASIAIAGGATSTASRDVALTLAASDPSGVTQMCVSNTSTCSGWVAYATSLPWTLVDGNGVKTVYAQFRDARGNVSEKVSDTITLDVPAPPAPSVDEPPSNATVSINGGATAAPSTLVTLTLSATDDNEVTQMCVSNTMGCTAWQRYATSLRWQLAPGTSGDARSVYVTYRDGAGQVSQTVSASIAYDFASPRDVAVRLAANAGSLTLSWTAGSDLHSGVAGYRIATSTSGQPRNCADAVAVEAPGTLSRTFDGLTPGVTYSYRVCTVDVAGNVSGGSAVSGSPRSAAPVGDPLIIEGGATWTSRSRVRLSINATDADGVVAMSIATVPNCITGCATPAKGPWIPYATSYDLELGRQGDFTVFIWFRDATGVETTVVNSAPIRADLLRPSTGNLGLSSPSRGTLQLAWHSFVDSGSGVARYVVVQDSPGAPLTCATGTEIYAGTDTSLTVDALTSGTRYGFAVCAYDEAGNVSGAARAIQAPR